MSDPAHTPNSPYTDENGNPLSSPMMVKPSGTVPQTDATAAGIQLILAKMVAMEAEIQALKLAQVPKMEPKQTLPVPHNTPSGIDATIPPPTSTVPNSVKPQNGDTPPLLESGATTLTGQLADLLKHGTNLAIVNKGARYSKQGGLLLDNQKVAPDHMRESDLQMVLARLSYQAPVKTFITRADVAILHGAYANMGITGVPTGVTRVDIGAIPVFEVSSTHSAPHFIKWQNKVVDSFKQMGLQKLLLVPLDVLCDEVFKLNIVHESKSLSPTDVEAYKIGIYLHLKQLANSLYYSLKAALDREQYVLEILRQHQQKETLSTHGVKVYLEGNLNYLWRALDHTYSRITDGTVDQLNRVFDSIRYGRTGATSQITSTLVHTLINDLNAANHELDLLSSARNNKAMKSKLLSCTPEVLYHALPDITKLAGMTYEEVGALLIEHARAIEERNMTKDRASAGSVNHIAVHGTNKKGGPNPGRKCGTCGRSSHTTEQHHDCPTCYRSHKPGVDCKPKGSHGGSGNPKQSQKGSGTVTADGKEYLACHVKIERDDQFFAVNYQAGSLDIATNRQCVIDSGGAAHICCDAKYLFGVKNIQHGVYVTLPDGSQIRVNRYGSMMISDKVFIRKVLFIPKFRVNIISVAKLADKGLKVKFGAVGCTIRNGKDDDKIILRGKRTDAAIYVMELPEKPYPVSKQLEKLVLRERDDSDVLEVPRGMVYHKPNGDVSEEPTTVAVGTKPSAGAPVIPAEEPVSRVSHKFSKKIGPANNKKSGPIIQSAPGGANGSQSNSSSTSGSTGTFASGTSQEGVRTRSARTNANGAADVSSLSVSTNHFGMSAADLSSSEGE